MGNKQETGLDPDEIFKDGVLSEQERLTEMLQEQVDAGELDPEVAALFSEGSDIFAPRKGKHRGKVDCSAKQRAKMPQICKGYKGSHARLNDPRRKTMRRASYHNPAPDYKGVHHTWEPVRAHSRRTFDSVPRKGGKRQKANDLMSKLVRNEMAVGGVAAVGTFLALYQQRAGVLKAAGTKLKDGTAVDGMLKAIQYDYEQFTTNGGWTGAGTRLQAAWKQVLGYGLGGILVNQVVASYVPKKYQKITKLIGDVLAGIGVGYAGKAVLDLPDNKTPPSTNNSGIRVIDVKTKQLVPSPQNTNASPGMVMGAVPFS